MWYCFSLLNKRIRLRDGRVYPTQRINHIQGDDDKTLCGIRVGQYWDFGPDATMDDITCLRCLRKLEAKAVVIGGAAVGGGGRVYR